MQDQEDVPHVANLQAFVERAIQTLKHEVLSAFCVVSEKHLDHLLKVGANWCNHRVDILKEITYRP